MARMFDALGSGAKPKTGRKTKKVEVAPIPIQATAPVQEFAVEQTQVISLVHPMLCKLLRY